jgi:uncharacterized membrane protein YhiD involved in acid resistance
MLGDGEGVSVVVAVADRVFSGIGWLASGVVLSGGGRKAARGLRMEVKMSLVRSIMAVSGVRLCV